MDEFLELLKSSPIRDEDLIRNLPLFINRIDLADMIFMIELYKKQLEVHGVIAEFGPRWGRNLALFSALRGIYEPYNHLRKIIGFDTFQGFSNVDAEDGDYSEAVKGAFDVTQDYEKYLDRVLAAHEKISPIPQKQKYELVKGDVKVTLPQYLEDNPETIFSLVYIDVDLYEPTSSILGMLKGHIVKGTVIGFDELCHPNWPGETRALKEVLELGDVELRIIPCSPTTSYFVV